MANKALSSRHTKYEWISLKIVRCNHLSPYQDCMKMKFKNSFVLLTREVLDYLLCPTATSLLGNGNQLIRAYCSLVDKLSNGNPLNMVERSFFFFFVSPSLFIFQLSAEQLKLFGNTKKSPYQYTGVFNNI